MNHPEPIPSTTPWETYRVSTEQALQQAIQHRENAANATNQTERLQAAVDAGNAAHRAQISATLLRTGIERELGSIAKETPPNELRRAGVTQYRKQIAEKLAGVPWHEIEAQAARHLAQGKELTTKSSTKLLPAPPRIPKGGAWDTYTAPPIDVALARELGMDEADERAQAMIESIQTALAEMENPRHAYVWAKYHGIDDDGKVGEGWSTTAIGEQLGNSREYIDGLYYRASHHVRGSMLLAALNGWATAMVKARQ